MEFDTESARVRTALNILARGIEHYGLTSVEGMRAKAIIDILVGVCPLERWLECIDPGHYIFGKGQDASERTHLLHVVEFEGQSWTSNLQLRDA